jgi:hypothetical protein
MNYKTKMTKYHVTIINNPCGDEDWDIITGWENLKKFSKRIENYNWEITKVERYGKVLLEEDGNPYRGRSLGRTFFGKEYKLESHDNDMMEQLQSEAETQ